MTGNESNRSAIKWQMVLIAGFDDVVLPHNGVGYVLCPTEFWPLFLSMVPRRLDIENPQTENPV